MATSALPNQPPASPPVRNHAPYCATCHEPLSSEPGSHAHFGDFAYHHLCLPVCSCCGREIDPDGETAWGLHAHVVPSSSGYAQHPVTFTCPECWECSLRDEAAGQE